MDFRQQALVFIVFTPVIWLSLYIYVSTDYFPIKMDKETFTSQVEPTMLQISETIWVYSAFLENTIYCDNVTVVTVLSVADEAIEHNLIKCRIDLANGESVAAVVAVTKVEDKYRLKYDLWKVFCKAGALLGTRPKQVTIFSNLSEPVTIPVAMKQEYVGLVGCCLSGPLWRQGVGDKGVMDLISWVEFQRMLGIKKILVYAMMQGKEKKEILDYYMREGVVDVTDWNFPINNRDFRYFGQNLLINDCLYRSRDLFNYTVFIDLDETIVPVLHDNLTDLLQNLTENRVSAYGFRNRFHHTHWRLPQSSLKSLYPSLSRIPAIQQAQLTHKVRILHH